MNVGGLCVEIELNTIPEERANDYKNFLIMFNKVDSEEARHMFMNM